ncbi:hypothetical protein [Anaerosphaera multitolerans]|uniref:Uncharacterized protein n=1 Tax=Anaerosphaera multitolerans TaxID=2487351 RepID=A0A437S794_9FIRM|nr:hypothetical protein [Anaerosphaera multitolerans]RVU54864.1 hypothetical protein EF514_04565 [Anaerosphaera multitolerans]
MEVRRRKVKDTKYFIKRGWLFIDDKPVWNIKNFLKAVFIIFAHVILSFIAINGALIGLENMVGI